MFDSDNGNDLSNYSFPHLNDTDFPLLGNVDVYEYQNEFDYSRWTDATKIHLCNVLWNKDYSNVVKFADDDARDKYFDSIDGYSVELTSAFNIAPNGTVKVPVPYQVATRYNYLFVDLPIMTSEDEPINYENPRRTKRYYYFINGVAQNAPSSTTLVVSPDNWTTYINNIDIPYLMLERGHAPMASVTVESYLSNPIGNTRYLLAPDFDFGGDDVIRSGYFVPVGNGDKYICFATTMSPSQVRGQQYPQPVSGQNTPATYEDADTRYGYQYIVNDYEWGLGGYDYNGFTAQTVPFQSANGSIPNNTTMVACKASDAASMFAYMSEHIPFVFKTIKACFMVDSSMVTLGTGFTYCNVTCYIVAPAADSLLKSVALSKADFGYDSKYANIAKLYTSPYSHIEVTDNNGSTRQFKIENTGNVQVRQAVALAYPYISIQAYLSGINGSDVDTYTWKRIDGTSAAKQLPSGDFGEYLWNWDIPTYALFVQGYDDYKASNYPNQYVERYNAITEYHNSVDVANTQYENSKDSADTTQTMTNNSAAAENTNAVNMADTINTNNINSANTGQSNANASANTAQTNTYNQAKNLVDNTALETAKNSYVTLTNVLSQENQVIVGNKMNQANQAYDAGLTRALTGLENQQTITSGVANAMSTVGNGISSQLGALGSLNFLGAIGSQVSMSSDIAAAGISTWVTLTTQTEVAEKTIENTQNKVDALNRNNDDMRQIAYDLQNNITNRTNLTMTNVADNSSTMMKTNADNTNAMEKANAKRTRDTAVGNADRTEATSVANANRTKNNSNTNAKLNRDTTVNNSDYTRHSNVRNAKRTLEQRRINNQQGYRAARLTSPVQYGQNNGDPTLDAFERRGLQIKVKTQPDGNIAQVGDLMLRYGYALNQVWNLADGNYQMMKHFTYWKASDIWINEGEGVNQDAQGDIQAAFERGVTVWSNPDEIGKVSIYDNWQ